MAHSGAHHPPPPPHILILTFPAQGHIIPAFNLSKLLASHGFSITFVCSNHAMPSLSLSTLSGICLAALPDRVPAGSVAVDQGAESFYWLMDIADSMQPDFELLLHRLSADLPAAPCCIISDFFLGWTQDVANKFHLPRFAFYPSPAASLCVDMYLPVLIAQGIVPLKSSGSDMVVVPGILPMAISDMANSFKDICSVNRREFTMKNCLRLHEAAGIVVNTFCELEQRAMDALQYEVLNPNKVKIYTVGPILPKEIFSDDSVRRRSEENVSGNDRECLLWLNEKPPSSVLYISFGSMALLSASQIREFAASLERCDHAFIWVLRPPPSTNGSSLSSIAEILPEGFQRRTQERGLIISGWAPQLLILSHPSVGGFLTHNGWNLTLESICHAVPMISFPQFAEQRIVCKSVVKELKIGVEVQRRENGLAESSEIDEAMRVVMRSEEGKKMKDRVRAVMKTAKIAVAECGSSYQSLKDFVLSVRCEAKQ